MVAPVSQSDGNEMDFAVLEPDRRKMTTTSMFHRKELSISSTVVTMSLLRYPVSCRGVNEPKIRRLDAKESEDDMNAGADRPTQGLTECHCVW
jgi:hypothetical protein